APFARGPARADRADDLLPAVAGGRTRGARAAQPRPARPAAELPAVSTLEVVNPFSGERVGTVELANRAAVRDALDRAAAWRCPYSRHERAELLFAVGERLGADEDAWAALITSESGLSLKDTRHEVHRAVDVFRFAAMEALRDDGELYAGDVTPHGSDRRGHTLRVPVRLVAAITP